MILPTVPVIDDDEMGGRRLWIYCSLKVSKWLRRVMENKG